MKFPGLVGFTLQLLLRGYSKSFRLAVAVLTLGVARYNDEDFVMITLALFVGFFVSNRLRIGVITGTIGSGKSTAISYIRQRYPSIRIIDADEIAKRIVAKGTPAHLEIRSLFGESILLPSGELDRSAIAKIVFSNPAKRTALNRITHWRIFLEIVSFAFFESVIKGEKVIADIPLFFESPFLFRFLFFPKILILSELSKTLQRIKLRNPEETEETVLGRIKAQLPGEVKAKMADFILRNDSDLDHLHRQVDDLLKLVF